MLLSDRAVLGTGQARRFARRPSESRDPVLSLERDRTSSGRIRPMAQAPQFPRIGHFGQAVRQRHDQPIQAEYIDAESAPSRTAKSNYLPGNVSHPMAIEDPVSNLASISSAAPTDALHRPPQARASTQPRIGSPTTQPVSDCDEPNRSYSARRT